LIVAKAEMALSEIMALNLARTIKPASIDLATHSSYRNNIFAMGS
jgi:hypothetical protein